MVDDRPDTFVARLAEVILYAFARGVDVEGTHHLAGGRPPVPDFTVTVMRIDKDRRTMPSNTADDTEFAARFQQFLLTEFAEGSEIVGSWPIRFPRPELPAWDVEIEIAGEAIDRRVPEFPDK